MLTSSWPAPSLRAGVAPLSVSWTAIILNPQRLVRFRTGPRPYRKEWVLSALCESAEAQTDLIWLWVKQPGTSFESVSRHQFPPLRPAPSAANWSSSAESGVRTARIDWDEEGIGWVTVWAQELLPTRLADLAKLIEAVLAVETAETVGWMRSVQADRSADGRLRIVVMQEPR